MQSKTRLTSRPLVSFVKGQKVVAIYHTASGPMGHEYIFDTKPSSFERHYFGHQRARKLDVPEVDYQRLVGALHLRAAYFSQEDELNISNAAS